MLDGAKSLAVPTIYGQDLVIEPINGPQLIWNSFTNKGECWLEAIFDLPKLRLMSATFESDKDGGADELAENLKEILVQVKKLNPSFLSSKQLRFENHCFYCSLSLAGDSLTVIALHGDPVP